MAGPTLTALCRSLPQDLLPFPTGRDVPAVPVTAVHVSELSDPSEYLEGGELLLTTGLSAVPSVAWFRGYFARLADAGVAALALGLGPRFDEVPRQFAQAADAVDLPLFIVPAATPFLTISRKYWELAAVPGRRQVADALAAHRAVIEAAVAAQPESAVIRSLASGVGGWAAHLSGDGAVLAVSPGSARQYARAVRDEVGRLAVVGAHAAATLPIEDQIVVLHPLADRARGVGAAGSSVAGYVAVGSAEALTPEQRHLVLAGVAVLGVQLNHRRELRAAQVQARTPVLQLLLHGEEAAAAALTQLVAPGLHERPHRAAVVVGPVDVLGELADLIAADPHSVLSWHDAGILRLLLADDQQSHEWLTQLIGAQTVASAVIGPPVEFELLHESIELLTGRAALLAPGVVEDAGAEEESLLAQLNPTVAAGWARRRLAPVLEYERAELVPALRAYLRHSGGWEAAARELDVHRHTLRHRVRRAEQLLDADLTSVDTATDLWLALRALGLA